MRIGRSYSIGRCTKFFRLALSHDNLANYYQTNFSLVQHHKYSLTELEQMIPWEREIYLTLLIDHLEKEKQQRELEKNTRKK